MAKQRQREGKQVTNPWWFALQLGFFAGLIWGGIHGVFYFMRFTKIIPGFLAEPFFKHAYLKTMPGYFIGWLFFIIFSILAALIYTMFLRKLKGPWPGLVYGALWWAVLFLLAGPALHMTPPFRQLNFNTHFSEFCLYLLWGLFIGYTAAMEYTDERDREPRKPLLRRESASQG
ncbi:YqhR family membrane protein [Paenibacillus sp. J22TS3]|uniref:YqhR family membrane protein n=1 Tax=Paenibacillus sp. J22TS3 TaxID=2807192 RepID=UPI001BCC8596|nr:YqhR family membrane protein [Paenibacillus sp. J22TS3]